MEPSFFLSYYRPWDESSSFIDSWGDYLRDTSLARYGADRVGLYIKEASRENVEAIQQASKLQAKATLTAAAIQANAIRDAANMIGFKLDKVTDELQFLNKRAAIALEQQRLNQLSLEELLRIPNSEKERLSIIKQGVSYFIASSNNPDLLDEALQQFLMAEDMKKQDYFVLHKIGCIYLFSKSHMDLTKAQDYFSRAGKYAQADADSGVIVGSNKLKGNFDYVDSASDINQILQLAADSYDKAALSSYILGDDNKAISFQELAVRSLPSGPILFNLAKYLFRKGESPKALKQLNLAVDSDPHIINAIFCDADVASAKETPQFIRDKYEEVENDYEEYIIDILSANDRKSPVYKRKQELINEGNKCLSDKHLIDAMCISGLLRDESELEKAVQIEEDIQRQLDQICTKLSIEEFKLLCRVSLLSVNSYDEFYLNYNKALACIKTHNTGKQ